MFNSNFEISKLLAPKTKEEILSQLAFDIKEIQQLFDELGIKGTFI